MRIEDICPLRECRDLIQNKRKFATDERRLNNDSLNHIAVALRSKGCGAINAHEVSFFQF